MDDGCWASAGKRTKGLRVPSDLIKRVWKCRPKQKADAKNPLLSPKRAPLYELTLFQNCHLKFKNTFSLWTLWKKIMARNKGPACRNKVIPVEVVLFCSSWMHQGRDLVFIPSLQWKRLGLKITHFPLCGAIFKCLLLFPDCSSHRVTSNQESHHSEGLISSCTAYIWVSSFWNRD